jgi:hypothetical protein
MPIPIMGSTVARKDSLGRFVSASTAVFERYKMAVLGVDSSTNPPSLPLMKPYEACEIKVG